MGKTIQKFVAPVKRHLSLIQNFTSVSIAEQINMGSTTTLYVFSGLPGSGKSTLAQLMCEQSGATYVRIDTVEQALRDLCEIEVEGEGYRLAYRIAADNLNLGLSVVADSCNPIALTRSEWQDVADHNGARYVNIEVLCTDPVEHRHRVETRQSAVKNLKLPTWEQVLSREYEAWEGDRITIDTAGRSPQDCLAQLCALLSEVSDDPDRMRE